MSVAEVIDLRTSRQLQIARLRADKWTTEQIARYLGITPAAVHVHDHMARKRLAAIEAKWQRDPLDEETPRESRARVARELAEGKRCRYQMRLGPCSLLLPCADHGE